MDGIEITQVIRGTKPAPKNVGPVTVQKNLPIVFVTAFASRYDKSTLLDQGGNDVVFKTRRFCETHRFDDPPALARRGSD